MPASPDSSQKLNHDAIAMASFFQQTASRLGATECPMCDYSLHHVKARPAKVGDKLIARDFGLGTRGFAASEDASVAVCVLPGTELCLAEEVTFASWHERVIKYKTAIFRQINLDKRWTHHDALEFPDGEIMLLTYLMEGQQATVLQLPATAVGSKLPQPLTYVLLPP
jgi:hypothetical protein